MLCTGKVGLMDIANCLLCDKQTSIRAKVGGEMKAEHASIRPQHSFKVPRERINPRIMLKKAYWMGRNEIFLCFIALNLNPALQAVIGRCRLVADALRLLDQAYPPVTSDVLLDKVCDFEDYVFGPVSQAFCQFVDGFSQRFHELRTIRKTGDSTIVLDQCTMFLRALGPPFDDWVTRIRPLYTPDRSGNRRKVCFAELRTMAEREWKLINQSDNHRCPSLRTNDRTLMSRQRMKQNGGKHISKIRKGWRF
jgi:hypothetical protein